MCLQSEVQIVCGYTDQAVHMLRDASDAATQQTRRHTGGQQRWQTRGE